VGERTSFPSDGLVLSGYLSSADSDEGSRNAILLCHGYPNKGRAAQECGKSFPQLVDRIGVSLGWDVLTLNYRGCALSEGNFSMDGWLNDVQAGIELLIGRGAEKIWLVGFGTGGSLCITAAAFDVRVAGVAVSSTPADFDDWAKRPRRLVAHSRHVGVICDPDYPGDLADWARGFSMVRAADRIKALKDRPVLIMHGTADDMIPSLDALALADAHTSAELRLLAGGGHELRHDPRAIAILIGWLRRHIGVNPAAASVLPSDQPPT
jgi:putative redox protein